MFIALFSDVCYPFVILSFCTVSIQLLVMFNEGGFLFYHYCYGGYQYILRYKGLILQVDWYTDTVQINEIYVVKYTGTTMPSHHT